MRNDDTHRTSVRRHIIVEGLLALVRSVRAFARRFVSPVCGCPRLALVQRGPGRRKWLPQQPVQSRLQHS